MGGRSVLLRVLSSSLDYLPAVVVPNNLPSYKLPFLAVKVLQNTQ
jgi:hypothetical protein